MRHLAIVTALLLVLVGCTPPGSAGGSPSASSAPESSAPESSPLLLWPLPSDPMGLATKAGLVPETSESLQFHVHAHLDVFKDGQPVVVPGGIGIDIHAPGVKRFDDPGGVSYGGISSPCANPCISPLHTHSPDGVIHTESRTPTPNTFGQFLVEWAVTLPADAKVYVDGKAFTGDPATIELSDRLEIAVVIGRPPAVIPSAFP